MGFRPEIFHFKTDIHLLCIQEENNYRYYISNGIFVIEQQCLGSGSVLDPNSNPDPKLCKMLLNRVMI